MVEVARTIAGAARNVARLPISERREIMGPSLSDDSELGRAIEALREERMFRATEVPGWYTFDPRCVWEAIDPPAPQRIKDLAAILVASPPPRALFRARL
jgi:hypothetical protein